MLDVNWIEMVEPRAFWTASEEDLYKEVFFYISCSAISTEFAIYVQIGTNIVSVKNDLLRYKHSNIIFY